MPDIWIVHSTFATREEVISVTQKLLENRLIACANIYGNVTSLYRWEGNIQQEEEVVLVAKTQENKVAAVIAMIKKNHSYTLPTIVAYPVMQGLPEFLQWVADETGEA